MTAPLPAGLERRKRRPLVEVERLSKLYAVRPRPLGRPRFLRAVDNVSLYVRHGESLGVLGESGAGKTTLGLALLRLVEPTYGLIKFDGRDLTQLRHDVLRPLRRHMQAIFQDPTAALDPLMTIEEIVAEPLRIHRLASSRAELAERVAGLLARVALKPDVLTRLPSDLSVGERQRVGMARALAVEPRFLVCDEPVSALDVSLRLQMLNILLEERDERQVALLLIAHDAKVIERATHRAAVMYFGRIVELGPTRELFESPRHPYTRALLGAATVPAPQHRRLRVVLGGDSPAPFAPPRGCAFHPRCPRAEPGRCDREVPDLARVDHESRHRVACFHPFG
jgi:oligopeptide transport system ATP-binding protein